MHKNSKRIKKESVPATKVKVLEFGSLQDGWEGINEYLYLECDEIEEYGGGANGPMWTSYNNFVIMKRAWVNPNFDFGLILGYANKKWSALVNNYIDFRYLHMMKAEIRSRVEKKARSYNYTYHFDNSHGSGKDCLISLTFTRRIGIEFPVVLFNIRTSEVTKRLLWDFLLVQRIIEYIYGHNNVEVHLFAPSYYITSESFVMYNNVKKIKKLVKHIDPLHPFQEKVLGKFKEYMEHPDPDSVRYRVHRRSILQIQRGDDGLPRSGVVSLKAKECGFKKVMNELQYPEDKISKSQRQAHDRETRKNG